MRDNDETVWKELAEKGANPTEGRHKAEIPLTKMAEEARPDGIVGGQGKSAHEISASSTPAGAVIVGVVLAIIVGLIIWFAKTSS